MKGMCPHPLLIPLTTPSLFYCCAFCYASFILFVFECPVSSVVGIGLHFPASLWLSFLRFPSWSWGRRNRGEAATLSVLDETVGPPSIPQTARAGRSCCISPSPAAPRSAARAQAIAMLASTARMTKQDHGKYKTSRRHDNQWRKKPPSHQPKVIGIMHSWICI